MAKRRRHRKYHGLGDVVQIPALSDWNPVGKRVSSTDILIGAVGGFALGGVLQKGVYKANDMLGGKLPNAVMNNAQAVGTAAAGAIAYVLRKQLGADRAEGFYVGALAAAGILLAKNLLGVYIPGLGDNVQVQLGDDDMYAALVNESAPGFNPGLNGTIVDEPAQLRDYGDNMALADLAALSMASMNEDEEAY